MLSILEKVLCGAGKNVYFVGWNTQQISIESFVQIFSLTLVFLFGFFFYLVDLFEKVGIESPHYNRVGVI